MITAEDIARFLYPLKIKLQMMVGRAVLTAVDNTGKTQRLQLKFAGDEVMKKIERMQEYGFETNPSVEDSSEVAYLSINGSRELTFVFKVQARALRPTGLATGEVQVYSKFGQKIYLKADGSVVIDAGGNPVNVTGSTITLTGNVNLKASGGNAVMIDTIINKLNNHVHGGVTAGAALTGTMTAGGTTLAAGTDSAANVKAQTG